MKLSEREKQELKNVEKWEKEFIEKKENGFLAKVNKFFSNSFSKAADKIVPKKSNKIFHKVLAAVETAIAGCMDAGQDIVKFTYDKNKAVKKFKKRGIKSLDDLYKIDVMELDKLSRRVVLSNKITGFIEGFAFGLGNITAAIADIPVFFSLTFRVMQQIAANYGYDPEDSREKLFMVKLMSFGTAIKSSGKLTIQAELQTLKVGIKRYTFKKLQEMGGRYSVVITARSIGKNVGLRLTKKTLLKGIPILGGAFGGFFNYGFIKNMADITNMMYKKRFLEDKIEK